MRPSRIAVTSPRKHLKLGQRPLSELHRHPPAAAAAHKASYMEVDSNTWWSSVYMEPLMGPSGEYQLWREPQGQRPGCCSDHCECMPSSTRHAHCASYAFTHNVIYCNIWHSKQKIDETARCDRSQMSIASLRLGIPLQSALLLVDY